jgi:UDP-N-acetylmuramate: L-alanyl-gamma-D-glutamyl-meso-diaminopimelate ligase
VKIHLIGVGGTAMATLAALLKRKGNDVQGSDENVYPPMSTFLESEQIRTFSGYDGTHITADVDLVIVGNAISRGNAELETVLDQKRRYCSLPEAVRDHFLWTARSIVIAGTHGKIPAFSWAASRAISVPTAPATAWAGDATSSSKATNMTARSSTSRRSFSSTSRISRW